MKVLLIAEFLDVYTKEYDIDGKHIISNKISVLNDDFNSDKDRIFHISVTDEVMQRLQLTDRSIVRKMVGKTFEFFCTARPLDKGLSLKCFDVLASKSEKNLPIANESKE